MSTPRLVLVGHDATDRNFAEVKRHISDRVAHGRIGDKVALVSGTNRIPVAVANARGRSTVFISDGTVTLSDVGLDADGNWVVTASGPCTARFMWHE